MPRPKTYLISKEDFSTLRLINNNHVLIRTVIKNKLRTSASGLIMVGDADFHPDVHADRWGEVVQVPSYLKRKTLEWGTDIEVQVGDKIWYDYMTGLNCTTFEVGNDEYKLMHYNDLYAVKRDNKVIMLNGYCLFSLVEDEKQSVLDIGWRKKDSRLGIGKYMGKCNTDYNSDIWVDDPRVDIGVKVVFGMPPVLLEDAYHSEFEDGGNLRISQRKFVLGIYDSNGGILPTKGNILVQTAPKPTHDKLGLEIPIRLRKHSKFGVVIKSECDDLAIGTYINFNPSSATYIEEQLCLMKSNAVNYTK